MTDPRSIRSELRRGPLILLLVLSAWGMFPALAQAEPAHPILTIPSVANSTTMANTVLSAWDETSYVNNFVPKQAPRMDSAGFAPMVVAGDTSWSWSASTPNQITSKPSNKVFPGATGYTQFTQNVTVLDGSTVAVPYYLAAGGTTKSLVPAVIDYNKRTKLRTDLDALADAYMKSGTSHASRNQAYARRIAVALYEYGKYVPKYFMTELNNPVLVSGGVNFMATDLVHRCSARNAFGEELDTTEVLAFDAIYDSPALADFSVEKGLDVRGFIATNLLGNMGDFFVYHMTPQLAASVGNLPGYTQVLSQMALVLNRPDYILWLDNYYAAIVKSRLNREGTILESLGYSINYIRTINTGLGFVQNYFVYRPADTPALLGVQSHLAGYSDILVGGIGRFQTISLPNGQLPSYGDTTDQGFFGANTEVKIKNAGTSGLMGAYGTVSLGAGTGNNSVQINSMFAGDENHKRSDTAALVLYAFKTELLGNIRYFNGSLERQFTEQPIAHNLVEIDRADMRGRSANEDGNGDLTLFDEGKSGFGIIEIDGQRIYSTKATRYQRILLLNSRDLAKPYVVDAFRVSGGTTHDFAFHGATEFDQTAECSFPLVTNTAAYPMLEPGEVWSPPTDQYDNFTFYGMWRNVNSNTAPGDFQITYRDPTASHRDLRLWMTDDGTAQVNIGRTPVPAREHIIPDSFFDNDLWRPSTIIRKRVATGPLQNLFVSVVEPLNNGVAGITNVERLPVTGNDLDSCALRITFTDGSVDTYLVNLRNPQVAGASAGSATVSTADGQYVLTGRIGVVSQGGVGARVWTEDATSFQYPGGKFTTPGRHFSGLIAGETRKVTGGSNDAFVTTSPLPLGTVLRDQQLSLNFGTLSSPVTAGISETFRIDQVIFTNSQYHVAFTNDHYLEITNGATSVEQQLPNRKFTTSNSFDIVVSANSALIPDFTMPANSSSSPLALNLGDVTSLSGAPVQVTVTSANPALIPNSNLVITGAGDSRTLTLTPLLDQTGTALITVISTDSTWTNQRSFWLTVTDPPPAWLIPAATSGPINSIATWDHVLPIAGDTNIWLTGAQDINMTNSTETFHGGTFVVQTNGQFAPGLPTAVLTLNNLVLDGGLITSGNNNGVTVDLSGDIFTLNSGTLKAGGANAGRDVRFRNGSLAGSGTIQITGTDSNGSDVEFQSTVDTKNFIGTFNVVNNGVLNLPPITTGNASFAVNLSGTGRYANDANVALMALVIDGTNIPPGTYSFAQFSPGQQAFLVSSTGIITVLTNTPPTLTTVTSANMIENTTTNISFTVNDAETSASALTVIGDSSNSAILPNSGLTFGGSGANRTIALTPALNQRGVTTIRLVVSDGILTSTNSFTLSVFSATPDTNPPLVNITAPANGSQNLVGTPVTVTATVTDNVWLQSAELYVNGVLFGAKSAAPFTWTVTNLNAGTQWLAVRAVDLSGNAATNSVSLSVVLNRTIFSDAADSSVYENGTVESGLDSSLLGAGGSDPWVDRCTIYVFQLPDLGNVANPFQTASFGFNYVGKQNTLKNNDLYGLGRRNAASVLASDYYGQTATVDPSDATLLQANILVNSSPIGLITNSAAGSTALVNYLNAQYADGAGIGRYVFLRLNSAGAKTGIARATLTMSEGAVVGPTDTRPQINFTTVEFNTAPSLIAVSNRTLIAGQTLTLTNVATDSELPAQTLTFSLLTPLAGATVNANNGAFFWRPTIAQSPSTHSIQVKVADNGSPSLSATNSFTVTVIKPGNPLLSAPVLNNGQLQFAITGDAGPDYVIMTSSNLTSWTPVLTNVSPVLPFNFTNASTNFSQFYRVLLGP